MWENLESKSPCMTASCCQRHYSIFFLVHRFVKCICSNYVFFSCSGMPKAGIRGAAGRMPPRFLPDQLTLPQSEEAHYAPKILRPSNIPTVGYFHFEFGIEPAQEGGRRTRGFLLCRAAGTYKEVGGTGPHTNLQIDQPYSNQEEGGGAPCSSYIFVPTKIFNISVALPHYIPCADPKIKVWMHRTNHNQFISFKKNLIHLKD